MARTKRKPGLKAQLKRKRENPDDEDTKPAKRPATEMTIRPIQHSPDPDSAVNPTLLADQFARAVRKWFPEKSQIELEDQILPVKAFLNSSEYDKPRIASNLPDFLEKYSPKGRDGLSTCAEKASPHTLVITSSGMRTADLYRELRIFQGDNSKVAKLIAKHMKLKVNVKYMQGNKIGIAISTPMRFKQLINADAVKIENISRLVIDGSYRDNKRNTIFMMDQVFQPLASLLNEEKVRQRYGDDGDNIKILVY